MRALYALLVKKLHPDINPGQTEREKELFLKVVAAYKTQDLAALRQILLMLDTDSLEDLSEDTLQDQIEKLEKTVAGIKERIAELESRGRPIARTSARSSTRLSRARRSRCAATPTTKSMSMPSASTSALRASAGCR